MVSRRLSPILRERGLKNFVDYTEILRGNKDEQKVLLSALTTNTTQFFRESQHFDLLSSLIRKRVSIQRSMTQKLRIWSAACSRGQEPYSLAICVLETLEQSQNVDAQILATDIDPTALEIAQVSEYDISEMQGVNAARRHNFFKNVYGKRDRLKIIQEVQNMVHFGQLNLVG